MRAKYKRVVNKLLPQGTRRRGAYDLGLTGVRVIANEGWRSFFRKARVWLKSKIAKRRVAAKQTIPDSNLRYELEAAGNNEVLLQFMLSHASPGSVIYDVGAYIGLYSILLAERIKNSLIYAFEPNPVTFTKLVENIKRVGLQKRVIALNAALDECCGKRSFNMSSDPARSSLYEYNATYSNNTVAKSVLVNCYSIDYLVESGLCKPPDIIKIDAEGNEHRVVFGSKSVIISKSPKICFEPHGLEGEDLNTSEPIKEFLSQFGYKFDSLGYPIWCYKPPLDKSNDKDTSRLTNNLHKNR